jgi:hypothetical protein
MRRRPFAKTAFDAPPPAAALRAVLEFEFLSRTIASKHQWLSGGGAAASLAPAGAKPMGARLGAQVG